MFRATSKKRKKTVTRLRSDSDDAEEEEEQEEKKVTKTSKRKEEEKSRRVVKKSKKSNKKKGLVVRSFELGEGDDDEVPARKKKKKYKTGKHGGGLGFGGGGGSGGAANVTVHDEDDFAINNNDENAESAANVYGKEALEKLKKEQQYKAPIVVEEETISGENASNKSQSTRDNGMPTQSSSMREKPEGGLGEYVPLNAGRNTATTDSNMILTGDEALDFETNNRKRTNEKINKEEHFDTVMEDSNFLNDEMDQQQAEETSAWEAEISRRAGIGANNSRQQSSLSATTPSRSTSNSSTSAMSLVKLRNQIQSTISQLETQDDDVDRACERRKIELVQTQEELQRQDKELQESGHALEQYQRLREQLTFWTGALRDLQSKIQPIQEALVDLDADRVKCPQWRNWEDDMCAILHQAGLLDRVLGRQPPDVCFQDTTTYVDEFGRDVKSQHVMNREKRMRHRLEIQEEQRQNNNNQEPLEEKDDDSDAGMGYDDLDAFQERRMALGKALEIALQELDEEYVQLSNLTSVFHEWQESHADDFKQCFANLSFGDLASVLVQVELCKTQTTTSNNKASNSNNNNNDNLFSWMEVMTKGGAAEDGGKSIHRMPPEKELVERIVEKAFIPFLFSTLDKGAYNLASRKQSRALSTMFSKISQLTTTTTMTSNSHFESLTRQLFNYIKASFDDLAIIILNSKEAPTLYTTKDEHDDDDGDDNNNNQRKRELSWAMHGVSSGGQLRRITKMLVNVITYWSPHLSTDKERGWDVIEFLLDFLSSRYLFLLSSIRTRSGSNESGTTKDLFAQVWVVLQETKWLDQPGRMLQAAPLRAAAAAAYQLN